MPVQDAKVAAKFAPKRSQGQGLDGANKRRLYDGHHLADLGNVMEAGTKKRRTNQRLSIFELEALREAFRRSVQENDVTEAEWARHAELFVKRMLQKGSLARA